jgi:hypothetical protein
MSEKHIRPSFSEVIPTRVLLEEDLGALETLSDLLTYYANVQPGDPVHFNDITKTAFLSIARTLRERVNERSIDYDGGKYIIMAKGRRKIFQGLKKEPDLYIGSEFGTNFIEACYFYFTFHSRGTNFNQRNLTYCGRSLFGVPIKNVCSYISGIKTTEDGYSVWFTIHNQTYNLAPEKGRGDAELLRTTLNQTFENLRTLKKTKP